MQTQAVNGYKLKFKPQHLKSKKEQQADTIFYSFLHQVVVPLVGKTTTTTDELDKAGRFLFGIEYKGTFPSDRLPDLNNIKRYAIVNLDKSNQKGSHWVALGWVKKKIYIYDSFGRDTKKIMPNIFKDLKVPVIATDGDSEQKPAETWCGAMCLAWLLVLKRQGPKDMLI